MFAFKVLIVLATCLSWSHCKLDKYCSLCKDHTMCKYRGIGKNCTNVGGSGVTEKEKKEIIDIHNWVRRIVAIGHESRGIGSSQPKAANLMKLVWDSELAKVAQRWADQCKFEHDTCRNDPRWNVGQNIYWKWKYPTHKVNWTEAIISWYDEVSDYDPKEVEDYRFEPSTGHYTQIMWHDTTAVGCGRRDYGPNKIYVCNYGPAGNWLGEAMYEIGEPCSKCPDGTVCDEYLCADGSKKSEIETPSDANNGKDSIDDVKPQKQNAKDENVSKGENKTKSSKTANQKAVKTEMQKINDILANAGKQKKTGGYSINENDIELDANTKKEVDKIRIRIEELLLNAMKKNPDMEN